MPKECFIRPYELSDIPFIVDTVACHVPTLPTYKNIAVSKPRIEYLLKHNYGNASYFQCWVLIDKETKQLVGGSAGYCTPGMLTTDLVANDVFLFVLPEWRTLRHCTMCMIAYREWAKARGAKLINATQTSGYRMEQFDMVMRRQGYVETGKHWMLRMD
jgi:hypothetical protein